MIEIGQLLRQTRESLGLSLADVEAETRIRQKYLSALESGDWDELPSTVTARGFLRRYASFLGLNPDELMAQIPKEALAVPATASAASDALFQPMDLDLYEAATRRSHLLRRVLGWAVMALLLFAAGYLLFIYGLPYLKGREEGGQTVSVQVTLPPPGQAQPPVIVESPTSEPTSIPPTFTPTPTLAATDTPAPSPTPTLTLSPSPTLTLTATLVPTETIRLRVVVTNTAWLRVATDGEEVIASLVDPGFDQEFTAHQLMEFLTGNAGGVQLYLNDEPLPPLGGIGEVYVYVWTLRDGEIIELTPTPLPTATPTPPEPLTPTVPITTTPGGQ